MKIGVGRGGTPVRALKVVSAFAGFFMRAAPAHPSDLCGGRTALPYTPTRARAMGRAGRGGHSLRRSPLPPRTIPIRPPPLFGGERCPPPTAAGFFVRCRGLLAPVRCAEMLRPPLPHPRGQAPGAQTWRLIFNKPPYLPSRVGGCVRRGAPSPCPRLPAPPKSLRRALEMSRGGLLRRLAANSATARRRYMRRSRLLRPVCALLAWLLVAALSSAEMPPVGRLGGSPFAPAPLVRALPVALLPFAPSLPLPRGRAAARPHALAGCFGGLLWGRLVCAHVNGWALSLCRPPFGRSHARSCPLGIAFRDCSIISLCVRSRGALRAPHR